MIGPPPSLSKRVGATIGATGRFKKGNGANVVMEVGDIT